MVWRGGIEPPNVRLEFSSSHKIDDNSKIANLSPQENLHANANLQL